jgi:hypothetical protein
VSSYDDYQQQPQQSSKSYGNQGGQGGGQYIPTMVYGPTYGAPPAGIASVYLKKKLLFVNILILVVKHNNVICRDLTTKRNISMAKKKGDKKQYSSNISLEYQIF